MDDLFNYHDYYVLMIIKGISGINFIMLTITLSPYRNFTEQVPSREMKRKSRAIEINLLLNHWIGSVMVLANDRHLYLQGTMNRMAYY